MNLAYVVICIVCCAAAFGRDATTLGRIIAIIVWLALSALFLATARADIITTPAPIPTLNPNLIRCTTFTLPDGPTQTKTMSCCAMWLGNALGQGRWEPMGCK